MAFQQDFQNGKIKRKGLKEIIDGRQHIIGSILKIANANEESIEPSSASKRSKGFRIS
jgi:hypothetical protein